MSDLSKVVKNDIPFVDDAEIATLVEQFEACRWPYERWTHRAHLAVAAFYLRALPLPEATEQMRFHIQQYNRTCGNPNGYHETITVLFMRLVHHRLQSASGTLAQFVDELMTLHDRTWPLRYYSAARLMSVQARAVWVEPDLRVLDI